MRFAPFLKLYKPFTAGFPVAMEILSRLTSERSGQAFSDFVAQQAAVVAAGAHGGYKGEVSGGSDDSLQSLLIRPVQRVPRYKLLLERLLEHTSELESEHVTLCTVLMMVSQCTALPSAAWVVPNAGIAVVQLGQYLRYTVI